MLKPLTPTDVINNLPDHFPDFVIKSINSLLMKYYRGGDCSFKKNELISEIIVNSNHALTRKEVYDNKYLDFETIYKKYGWNVEFHSPDRGESFDDFYRFKSSN